MRIALASLALAVIMAFGAGVLISAVAYELVFEAVAQAKGTGGPTAGLFLGALTFFFADRIISNMGASDGSGTPGPAPPQKSSTAWTSEDSWGLLMGSGTSPGSSVR